MRLSGDEFFHLTYCTNIHPAEGWTAVFDNLSRYAPALKARLSRSSPFGLGLRLSAREARELVAGNRLRVFREYLDSEGLYVAIINGFPYGPFHSTVVKANVYAPDWRDDARVAYTSDLIEILAALLPDGIDGGVSTAPLSYKAWMPAGDDAGWEAVTRNVARIAERLVRVRESSGRVIHLDIEPEPDCSIENTDETLAFFERHLLVSGATWLARSMNVSLDAARAHLLEHVRICFDCCHFAVEYEEAAVALDRITGAGIKIGRVQLSSALRVSIPEDPAAAAETAERLRRFADATYLHQVVEQAAAGSGQALSTTGGLRHFPDLPEALRESEPGARQWRIHFHVPLFTASYETLGSTQDYVRGALEHILQRRLTRHLEIETYTWDVLPPGLKEDLPESIAREYDWVLGVCRGILPG